MRTFIAIDLPLAIKDQLEKIQNNLSQLPVKAKWVSSKNLHITLKFLGDTSKEKIEAIKEVCRKSTREHRSFCIDLENFGFLPNLKKPRVLFVDFSCGKGLESLVETLEENLEKTGFKKEKKFRPHITLARIKDLKNINQLAQEIDKLKIKSSFDVKKISLYESTLTNKGPIYKEIFKSSLKP